MIMNRIKIVLSIFAFLFAVMQANAQSFRLNDLVGKTWTGVSGYYGCDVMSWSISFGEKNAIHRGIDKKGKDIATFSYNMYLSNNVPKKYDDSLLGKSQSGKYIVFERKYDHEERTVEDFQTYEIISLTSNKLVVKSNGLTITFVAK